MEHIIKLFERLGVPNERATEFIDKGRSEDDMVQEIVRHQQSIIRSDNEFIGNFKKEGELTAQADFNKMIKKHFALSAEEVQDKKLNEIFDIGKEKLIRKITEQFEDKSTKTLMEEHNKSQAIIRQREEEIKMLKEETIPSIHESVRKERENMRIDLALERYVEKKPLAVAVDIVFPALKSYLNNKEYVVKETADGLKLYNSDGLTVPLNDDKTSFISLDDVTTQFLTQKKLVHLSNGANNGQNNANHQQSSASLNMSSLTSNNANTIIINKNEPNKSNMLGVDKINKRLAHAQVTNTINP